MVVTRNKMPVRENDTGAASGADNSLSVGGKALVHPQRHNLKNRFELLRTLGEGTYGKVKLASEKSTGEQVAIKYVKKTKIRDEMDLNRIRREIRILSTLRHPHIVNIRQVFEKKDRIVLVMDCALGGELYDYLNTHRHIPEPHTRHLFRQIVSAVHYMHQNSIVHRDLKLENIVLDSDGNIKVADFGLANYYSYDKTLTTFCGSPLYASPEIVNGKPYHGPEVDVWSMGVVLYTLAYGAMPFESSNLKVLRQQITQGHYTEPAQPCGAAGLIRHMLTVTPARRATLPDILNHWWLNLGYDLTADGQRYEPNAHPSSQGSPHINEARESGESLMPVGGLHRVPGARSSKRMGLVDALGTQPCEVDGTNSQPHVVDALGLGLCGDSAGSQSLSSEGGILYSERFLSSSGVSGREGLENSTSLPHSERSNNGVYPVSVTNSVTASLPSPHTAWPVSADTAATTATNNSVTVALTKTTTTITSFVPNPANNSSGFSLLPPPVDSDANLQPPAMQLDNCPPVIYSHTTSSSAQENFHLTAAAEKTLTEDVPMLDVGREGDVMVMMGEGALSPSDGDHNSRAASVFDSDRKPKRGILKWNGKFSGSGDGSGDGDGNCWCMTMVDGGGGGGGEMVVVPVPGSHYSDKLYNSDGVNSSSAATTTTTLITTTSISTTTTTTSLQLAPTPTLTHPLPSMPSIHQKSMLRHDPPFSSSSSPASSSSSSSAKTSSSSSSSSLQQPLLSVTPTPSPSTPNPTPNPTPCPIHKGIVPITPSLPPYSSHRTTSGSGGSGSGGEEAAAAAAVVSGTSWSAAQSSSGGQPVSSAAAGVAAALDFPPAGAVCTCAVDMDPAKVVRRRPKGILKNSSSSNNSNNRASLSLALLEENRRKRLSVTSLTSISSQDFLDLSYDGSDADLYLVRCRSSSMGSGGGGGVGGRRVISMDFGTDRWSFCLDGEFTALNLEGLASVGGGCVPPPLPILPPPSSSSSLPPPPSSSSLPHPRSSSSSSIPLPPNSLSCVSSSPSSMPSPPPPPPHTYPPSYSSSSSFSLPPPVSPSSSPLSPLSTAVPFEDSSGLDRAEAQQVLKQAMALLHSSSNDGQE